MPRPLTRFLWLTLPFFAAVFAYIPCLDNEFVWDDTALILRDPLIRSWRLIGEGFRHFLFLDATASDFYRPLQRLTYTLDYAVWGLCPFGYHLTNVICHGAAAVALADFLRRLLARTTNGSVLAALSATLWAVHPIHTSAVAYISGRADLLAAMFGFLALSQLLRSDALRPSLRRFLIVSSLLLCAAISKEFGLIFCATAIVLVLFLKRTIRTTGAMIASVVIVLLAVTFLRLPANRTKPPARTGNVSFLDRTEQAFRAAGTYVCILFWPEDLRMERDVRTPEEGNVNDPPPRKSILNILAMIGALAVITNLVLTIWAGRNKKAELAFLGAAAMTTYIPISGILRLNASVAEHWLYVPSAFLLAMAIFIANAAARRAGQHFAKGAMGTAVALVAVLGSVTALQCEYWRDQQTFVRETIARGGRNPRMLVLKANLAAESGALNEALAILEPVVRHQPWIFQARLTYANLRFRTGDSAGAIRELAPLIEDETPAVRVRALENTFAVLFPVDPGAAEVCIRRALETMPSDWSVVRRYATFLESRKRQNAAIQLVRSHLREHWWRAQSWLFLAELLERTGAAAPRERANAERFDVHLHDKRDGSCFRGSRGAAVND